MVGNAKFPAFFAIHLEPFISKKSQFKIKTTKSRLIHKKHASFQINTYARLKANLPFISTFCCTFPKNAIQNKIIIRIDSMCVGLLLF